MIHGETKFRFLPIAHSLSSLRILKIGLGVLYHYASWISNEENIIWQLEAKFKITMLKYKTFK